MTTGITLLSRVLHDILKYNKDEIKFINSGVRIFSRTEAKVDAPYRITQEGVNTMKSFCRKQNVTTSSLKDIEILLSYEYPDMEKLRLVSISRISIDLGRFYGPQWSQNKIDFSDVIKKDLMTDTISGSFIMTYVPNEDETNVSCKISLVGWRGEKSCRLYIGKHDRVHYLHLLGMNLKGGLYSFEIFFRSERTTRMAENADKHKKAEASKQKR